MTAYRPEDPPSPAWSPVRTRVPAAPIHLMDRQWRITLYVRRPIELSNETGALDAAAAAHPGCQQTTVCPCVPTTRPSPYVELEIRSRRHGPRHRESGDEVPQDSEAHLAQMDPLMEALRRRMADPVCRFSHRLSRASDHRIRAMRCRCSSSTATSIFYSVPSRTWGTSCSRMI